MNQKQCKMARIGLGWTLPFFAEKAGVSPQFILDFENGVHESGRVLEAGVGKLRDILVASNRVTFQGSCSVFIEDE
ncbi:MAG: hypothetical protein AB8B86_05095 [Pseudomonadales bacterium]